MVNNMDHGLPKFSLLGYDDWKIMMEAHLYALHDCMWMVLEDGPLKIQMENPERNPATPDVVQYIPKPKEKWDDRDCKKHNLDNVAKAAIFKTLDPITFSKIKHLKTAMEIWQGLGKLCEGSEDLRKQKVEVLLEKFKSFKMLPGESFDMLDERFHKILNDLASLNHVLSPKEKNTCKEQRTLEQHKTLLQRERVHSNFTNAVNKLGEGGYSAFTPTRDNACTERRAVEKQKTLRNPSVFVDTTKEDGNYTTCTPTPPNASAQERATEKIYSIGTNKPTQTCKEQRTLEQHKTLLQRERVHSNFTNAVNKLGEGGYSVFTPTRDNAFSERRAVEKQKTLGNAWFLWLGCVFRCCFTQRFTLAFAPLLSLPNWRLRRCQWRGSGCCLGSGISRCSILISQGRLFKSGGLGYCLSHGRKFALTLLFPAGFRNTLCHNCHGNGSGFIVGCLLTPTIKICPVRERRSGRCHWFWQDSNTVNGLTVITGITDFHD
ncbi:unnamed protein product [Cuscuta campestris]|uniref:DUF4219 domain-containing protein n=1 Tax=Cuscuta campestris TaxID=132261 RepID=A0A484ND75_9ASTE|nr:unnamed protein product [Cuscuta campestris]